jgi:sugar lactone lactonase YvrE
VKAELFVPIGVAVDAAGNVYIAEARNSRVRKVDPSGRITTFAGNGTDGFSGDGGPATAAMLDNPYGVAVDPAGNVYIADTQNNRIRKVDTAGIITTIAGTGTLGCSGDEGAAIYARISVSNGIAADSAGAVYFTDSQNSCIRKITPNGRIATVKYNAGASSTTALSISMPNGLALDTAGNIYYTDLIGIKKLDTAGTLTVVAGEETIGYSGDGEPALKAQFKNPFGIVVDPAGGIYVTDKFNQRVRKIDPAGTITTIAGDGVRDFLGEGVIGTSARLSLPSGIAIDRQGTIYFSDQGNHRIRKLSPVKDARAKARPTTGQKKK